MSKTDKKERQFLLFAGTKEGRELAEYMSAHRIPAMVCVATGYGEELLQPDQWIRVRVGRLDEPGIERLIRETNPLAVIDATHPYADVATANLRCACEACRADYCRLVRDEEDLNRFDGLRVFGTFADAAQWLDGQEGNILLTTGIKELPCFAETISDRNRIFVRTLLQDEIVLQMERYGLSGKQVICMQGPFSVEMNAATLKMTGARYLVTKESGVAGGFAEKAEAAKACGAVCVVIRRPVYETGYSVREIRKTVEERWKAYCSDRESGRNPVLPDGEAAQGGEDRIVFAGESFERRMEEGDTDAIRDAVSQAENRKTQMSRRVTLLGIGMGSRKGMTEEAVQACRHADCIIGAKRMLETLREFGKPMEALYRSDEIAAYVDAHPEYRNIVVAFSGDVGFYSGAKKLLELWKLPEKVQSRERDGTVFARNSSASDEGDGAVFAKNFSGGECENVAGRALQEKTGRYSPADVSAGGLDIRLIPGVSGVSYFAARLQIPWEDMTLLSTHGREQNLVGAVSRNEKVFTLASDAASIRSIAQKLVLYGLGTAEMHVGCDLSYPTEKIYGGSAADFADFEREGMFVAVICNRQARDAVAVHGIPDAAFLRGKAPMTKEEVRSISVSKLRLTRDAIVYDVGAGTGSVAVECARMADQGRVYAIEWKEDAWKLIAENRKIFAVSNLEIVPGRAPDVFEKLPAPTHAFIGGSGGSLKAILMTLLKKNPEVRIVANCVTLETLTELVSASEELGMELEDIAGVTVAKAAPVGKYHMMQGQNPVYVITLGQRRVCPDRI
ncbi:MAG: precorrin-6A reductase [Clostridiales bacterium]|nr:precorrin-6A reductase [Clostridiales bacterium]